MERPEFQVHSNYDHKVFKTMSRVLRKTTNRKIHVVIRVFGWVSVTVYALLQLFLITGRFFFSWMGDYSPDLAGILVALGLLAVLSGLLFEDDLNAWIAAANLMPGTREADTRFGPDGYVVVTQAAETRMYYKNIRLVGETADSFVFLIGKRHAQQFPKAGLTGGTAEEFRAFLTEKTGLPVR